MTRQCLTACGDPLTEACLRFQAGPDLAGFSHLFDAIERSTAGMPAAGAVPAYAMREALSAIAASGFLGATASGDASIVVPPAARLAGLERIGWRSNELAFLCQQHQGALSLLWAERDDLAPRSLIASYASGMRTLGIAASHLRLPAGSRGIVAAPVNGSIRLRGHASWVTGYGVFDDVLVGARTPEGATLFFVLPFMPADGVRIEPITDLWAMRSTSTVTIDLDLMLPQDAAVSADKTGRFGDVHGGTLTQPCCHLFAVAHRTIGHLRGIQAEWQSDLVRGLVTLISDLNSDRSRFYELMATASGPNAGGVLDEMLYLRAAVTARCFELVSAVCALTGGRSVLQRHSLSRLIEETMFFTTVTVTPQVKATLAAALSNRARTLPVTIRGAVA